MNAECGMRNARCHAERSEASQSREQTLRFAQGDNHSAFVVAFGRAALALTSLLAVPAATGGVQAAERETEVAVWTVEPQAVRGRLVAFSLRDGAIVRTGADKRTIPTADIIRITSPGAPGDMPGEGDRDSWIITLTWGDLLSGRVIAAHGESLVIDNPVLGEVAVPLETVARIASSRAVAGAHRAAVQWLDHGRPTDDDRVLLTNGDVLHGFISAIDADGIAIDTGGGSTTAPFRLVVAARLAHPAPPAPPHPSLILTLRDGGRLTATALDWVDAGVEARLRAGVAVHIDADRIIAVDVIGGRWEWLSEQRPVSYEQAPMLGLGWEYTPDRNVLGGPITVGGERYERGIGVHSRSNLVFELNGAYREFVTSYGLDDDSGPLADVTVMVLVDGQRRLEKTHVRRGTLFGPVRVDLSHAGRIELIVDYGDNGDLQDRFDWVEAGLIR